MHALRPALICFVAALVSSSTSEAARKEAPPAPSRMERLSRIAALEDARSGGQGELARLLRDSDRGIRRRAALAAGRIGRRDAVPTLVEMMNDVEPEVRQMAAFSLGLIADATAVDRLVASLAGDGESIVRARAAEALGRIGDVRAVPALVLYVRKATPSSATTLVIRGDDPANPADPWAELRQGLLALSRLGDPKALEQVLLQGTKPRYDWWVSAWIASRAEASSLGPVLSLAAQSNDVASRIFAAKGLGAAKDPEQLALLATLAHDPNDTVVISALRALGATANKSVVPTVAVALESRNSLVVREALRALARLPGEPALRQRIVRLVGHEDAGVRGPALVVLARLSPAEFTLVLSGMDPDPDFAVRSAVATALGDIGDEVAISILFSMLKDPDARVLPAVLGALRKARGRDAIETLQAHLGHADPGVRAAAAEGLGSLAVAEATPALANTWRASRADGDLEARIAILGALQAFSTPESAAVLTEIATSDPARAVRLRAASILASRKLPVPEVGIDVPSRRPLDYRVALAPFDPVPGERLYSPRALLHTKRGVVEILLDVVETPLTSATFIDLAQGGFFDGLTFHRVESGFVVQGGDPRGDGRGGPGFSQRCEIAQRSFGRGGVGMALSGRDTGGSQFFVTTTPQPHLDGAYTLFGQVTRGLEIVDAIAPGDRIERVEIWTGRE